MKSDFVSTVSVELRTPLTSIYGFAQTLLREDVAFGELERRTFLEFIARESERLTAIVDALLNVARLDTGDLNVSLVPTDVGARRQARSCRRARDCERPPVRRRRRRRRLARRAGGSRQAAAGARPARLERGQVLAGRRHVTVSARGVEDAVEVAVADEGVGSPAAERERIFSKFYKAGERRQGTGLGLFIAQGLVREMGGRMWVDSEEGRGSRFAFELPLAEDRV